MEKNIIISDSLSNVRREDKTVGELFEEWLESKKDTLRPATYKYYQSKYRLYLQKQFGDTKVNEITPEQWSEYENMIATQTGANGRPLSLPTIRNLIRLSHMIFAYGTDTYGLNDPTGDTSIPTVSSSSESIFNQQELEKLKAAVKPYDVHHLCIMLCIYTGVQIGEICGAKWGDIDTDKSLLKIRRSLVRESIYGEPGKTELRLTAERHKNTFRDVHIPDWINAQFKLIKRMHKDDEFIVVGKLGGIQPNNFINTYYTKFLSNAGVKYRSFTATRNTYVKSCIEQGIELDTISVNLGHPSADYTKQKYSGYFQERIT